MNENKAWQTQTKGIILSRPRTESGECTELLDDLNFSRGLYVTLFHSNSSNGLYAGQLTHGEERAAGGAVWQLAQWGCTHDISKAPCERRGSVLTYDDGGKLFRVDVARTGAVTLGIRGSREYTRDEQGRLRERLCPAENWPHILVEQRVGCDIGPDVRHLFMEVHYKVTSCASLVDRSLYPVDPDRNAAQFQWFITLIDADENSPSFGKSMWFGFSMFDTRAEGGTPQGFCSYDGGKEDSTGLFIYMPSLEEVAASQADAVTLPTSVIGRERVIRLDILPLLNTALSIAQKQGAMTGAGTRRLRIGSTNIGWELPGNYDAEVEISYLNLYSVRAR